jgi:TRAP-type C4-dicarboxylate transport system permease small subunit
VKFAQNLLQRLFAFEITVAILAFMTIFGLLLFDVLSRELGFGSIWGAQRISVYLMIVTGFLGLGLAAAQGRHLRPKFLDNIVPQRSWNLVDRIGSILMCLIFLGFALVAIQFLKEAIEYSDLARVIKIPIWYIQVIVPYAFFSTAVRYGIFALYPDLRPEEALE